MNRLDRRYKRTDAFNPGLLAGYCLLLMLFLLPLQIQAAEKPAQQTRHTNRLDQYYVVPANYLFDGHVEEWRQIPPTFILNKYGDKSRDGHIWVGQDEQGLIVAGIVRGAKPRWPDSPDKMSQGDHLELWLADANEPVLPPVGWGNQFGFEELASEKDCSVLKSWDARKTDEGVVNECVSWFNNQLKYRKSFRKLFVRQWQIAPAFTEETYSSPAFSGFGQDIQKKLRLLKPSGAPIVKMQESADKGDAYTFEIFVPWNAFPPMKPLQINQVRIMVDIFSPGSRERGYGVFSSTAAKRKYGNIKTFNTVQLKPRNYYLTPCKYELPKSDPDISLDPAYRYLAASAKAQLYFFPAADTDLRRLLLIDNEAMGYQYKPDPKSNSPIVHPVDFFTRQISDKELLCGPRLAYVKDDAVKKWPDIFFDSEKYFEAKKLTDGSLLVKNGPRVYYSYYGSGQCGACPRVMLLVYHLDLNNKVSSPAFEYHGTVQAEDNDIDIHVSENWQNITVYNQHVEYTKDEKSWWIKKDYCFDPPSRKYIECGIKDPSQAPPHRTLKYDYP
jgi:hypothetical protein